MVHFAFFSLVLSICFLNFAPTVLGQAQFRRFTRSPYYTGPDDPERGQIRGTLKLGETVIIEVPGDTGDIELKPGVVPDPNVTPPRGSRPGGPFEIEGIKPGDWVSISCFLLASTFCVLGPNISHALTSLVPCERSGSPCGRSSYPECSSSGRRPGSGCSTTHGIGRTRRA